MSKKTIITVTHNITYEVAIYGEYDLESLKNYPHIQLPSELIEIFENPKGHDAELIDCSFNILGHKSNEK